MHTLAQDLWNSEPAPATLARLPLDGGAIVACFPRRARPDAPPRWIAKTAYGEAACERLRAEAEALAAIEPLSLELGLPRLLGWRTGGAGERSEACLAQSGVAGKRLPPPAVRARPKRSERALLASAVFWIQRFQDAADAAGQLRPRPLLAEVAALAAARADAVLANGAEPGDVAECLRFLLAAVRHLPQGGAARPAAVVHGDFWTGNVLRNGAALSVVDWSGLGCGSALDDLCTWLAAAPVRASGGPTPPSVRAERWRRVFFSPGHERNALRSLAAERGYVPALSAWAFDLFLLRRLLWELGYDRQERNPEERGRARREWVACLAARADSRAPDPFRD